MVTPKSFTPTTPKPPKSHKLLSETCRLWEQECLRAWLEMKQDIAQVQQDPISLDPTEPTLQRSRPQPWSISHNSQDKSKNQNAC